MRVLQWAFTYFATILMIIGAVPQLAIAKTNAPVKAEKTAKTKKKPLTYAQESTLAAYKMMRPRWTQPNLGVLYGQGVVHMSGTQKIEFGHMLSYKGLLPAPDFKMDGDAVLISQGGYFFRMKMVGDNEKNLKMVVNGRVLTNEELSSPNELVKVLEKIVLKSAASKSAFWPIRLLVPEAHAFEMFTLLIGAALGFAAYWAYNKFFASDAKKCAVAEGNCCQNTVDNRYESITSNCCSEANTAWAPISAPASGCSGPLVPTALPASDASDVPIDTMGNSTGWGSDGAR